MQRWAILNRDIILATKWLTVFRDVVRTTEGRIIDDYYIAKKQDVAMVAALTTDNQIVLIKEYKHGCGDDVWQLPAGGISEGTSAMETAVRELAEETGVTAQSYELLGSWYVSPTWLTTTVFVFLAKDAVVSATQSLEVTEDIEAVLVPLDEALNMVTSNEIRDPLSSLAILWISHQLKKSVDETKWQ